MCQCKIAGPALVKSFLQGAWRRLGDSRQQGPGRASTGWYEGRNAAKNQSMARSAPVITEYEDKDHAN